MASFVSLRVSVHPSWYVHPHVCLWVKFHLKVDQNWLFDVYGDLSV